MKPATKELVDAILDHPDVRAALEKPKSNEQSWQGIMANKFLREREELLEAAQILASYTLGFSENPSVADAKETVERIRGNRDDVRRARATSA